MKGFNYTQDNEPQPRKRSNSLPVPKIEVTVHESNKEKIEQQKEMLPNIIETRVESFGQSSERFVYCLYTSNQMSKQNFTVSDVHLPSLVC